MKSFNQEFILQWIRDIAPKLAPLMSFDDWMGEFKSRYPAELLIKMKTEWNKFNLKRE